MKTNEEIIQQAKALCEKFVNKVESGRARSKVTYAECVELLQNINEQAHAADSKTLSSVGVCPTCGLEHYSHQSAAKCCSQTLSVKEKE